MDFNATLVVMAAGMGSRFGGLKQIEPVGPGGQAILDFSVYDAKAAGFNKVVFIIKQEIEKDFKEIVGKRIEKMIDVEYAFQETYKLPEGYTCPADRTKPWGTGHAVYCCRDIVNEPFAVINADDYYGKSAFKQIYDFLKKGTGEYCMVGFRLANTLTENGSVSRGVCTVKDGALTDVTERTKIIDCKYTEDGEKWIPLAPDTIVSMNMWGFTPDIFEKIGKDFVSFLDEKLEVPKSEFYLPSVVSGVIERGEKRVEVLVAEDKWYGVTYKEDKQGVVDAIRAKFDNGEYAGI
ncbi:MAG: sugar phosphate nucleotidyltransferase [Acutalibacteraceae bacterium]|nr:sugar phosphate nucleotidyltransferase [Acutalibacteraceae bacterium]